MPEPTSSQQERTPTDFELGKWAPRLLLAVGIVGLVVTILLVK